MPSGYHKGHGVPKTILAPVGIREVYGAVRGRTERRPSKLVCVWSGLVSAFLSVGTDTIAPWLGVSLGCGSSSSTY